MLARCVQMLKLLRRWLPQPEQVVVGDNAFAALDFLYVTQQLEVTVIARLRLDAALYEPASPYPGMGRPRKKGKRLPMPQQLLHDPHTCWTLPWYAQSERPLDITTFTAVWFHYGLTAVPIRWILIRDVAGKFEPQALLSTDLTLTPEQILAFLLRRWQMEPIFRHVRTHLGVETQRQWSDKAIARTPPALLGLFSLITLLAHTLIPREGAPVRSASWYPKTVLTFSDALALVRHHLWLYWTFHLSADEPDMVKVPRPLLERFNDLLCYAA